MQKRFHRFLADNFITGLVVILPIILTIAIIRFFVIKLNQILLLPLQEYLTPYFPAEQYRFVLAKTIIFLAVVIAITLVGLATRIIVVRRTFSFFEKLFLRLPMVNKIYSTTKEISNAFLGERRGVFKRVVLIEYPRKGIYSIAFVTSDSESELGRAVNKKLLSAYVPTTPNPTSGVFLLVPKDEAVPIEMSVEEGFKMVISSGVIYSGYSNGEHGIDGDSKDTGNTAWEKGS